MEPHCEIFSGETKNGLLLNEILNTPLQLIQMKNKPYTAEYKLTGGGGGGSLTPCSSGRASLEKCLNRAGESDLQLNNKFNTQ